MTTTNPIVHRTSHILFDDVTLYPIEMVKETCNLCLEKFEINDKIIKLKKCKGHFFHKDCNMDKTVVEWVEESGSCPLCRINYGIKKSYGPSGDMVTENRGKYIEMVFHLESGTNPETKKRYHGENRIAYLPNTQKGKQVLKLFQKGHTHGILFTVGRSLTRNIDNVIIYNGIHMKTSIYGGGHSLSNDRGYLDRVIDEFKQKGIMID